MLITDPVTESAAVNNSPRYKFNLTTNPISINHPLRHQGDLLLLNDSCDACGSVRDGTLLHNNTHHRESFVGAHTEGQVLYSLGKGDLHGHFFDETGQPVAAYFKDMLHLPDVRADTLSTRQLFLQGSMSTMFDVDNKQEYIILHHGADLRRGDDKTIPMTSWNGLPVLHFWVSKPDKPVTPITPRIKCVKFEDEVDDDAVDTLVHSTDVVSPSPTATKSLGRPPSLVTAHTVLNNRTRLAYDAMTYSEFHCLVGHPHFKATKRLAHQWGIRLVDIPSHTTGILCFACGVHKAKPNPTPQQSN